MCMLYYNVPYTVAVEMYPRRRQHPKSGLVTFWKVLKSRGDRRKEGQPEKEGSTFSRPLFSFLFRVTSSDHGGFWGGGSFPSWNLPHNTSSTVNILLLLPLLLFSKFCPFAYFLWCDACAPPTPLAPFNQEAGKTGPPKHAPPFFGDRCLQHFLLY